MRIRDWSDVLADVTESGAEPDHWRAVGGDRRQGLGEDLYLAHPDVGVFALKTYAKNPREVRGVGTRVARRVDEDLDSLFPREPDRGRFAVTEPPEDADAAEEAARELDQVVEAHADAPTTPDDFVTDVLDALDSPAHGPMDFESHGRPEGLDALTDEFEEAEELLGAELDDLVDEDEVGRGFQ